MAPLSLSVFPFFVFLHWHWAFGQVMQNTTVDDDDPMIQYIGGWGKTPFTELNEGGYHRLTSGSSAQAIFEFTGVAVYFLSPLWPYVVTTQIQLDSRSPQLLDLMDYSSPTTDGGPETIQSHVVWAAEGLENGRHILKISVGPGQRWAIVDGFIVTRVDENPQTSSVSSAAPTLISTVRTDGSVATTQKQSGSTLAPLPNSTVSATTTTSAPLAPSSSSSRSKNALVIGLASGVGALALLITVLLCYICRRQSRVLLEDDGTSVRNPLLPPSVPPWSPTSTTTSPTSPTTFLFTRSPEEEQYSMVRLTPHRSWNTSTSGRSVRTAARQASSDELPSYEDSANTYRRARRSTLRKSRMAPRNPD